MPKSLSLAGAAVVATIAIGGSTATSAEELCSFFSLGSAFETNYHGYSNKVAAPGAPGTSTVSSGENTFSQTCFDSETGQITGTLRTTTTSENYTKGPGNSKFEKFNPISGSSTCAATGTLSCP